MRDFTFRTNVGLHVISGSRSRADQARLEDAGRPTAPFLRSTHADQDAHGCPRLSTGADLALEGLATGAHRLAFGQLATFMGLRWGGGGPVDPETGMPLDWNHLDTGSRTD